MRNTSTNPNKIFLLAFIAVIIVSYCCFVSTNIVESYSIFLVLPAMAVIYEGLISNMFRYTNINKSDKCSLFATSENTEFAANLFNSKSKQNLYLSIPNKYLGVLSGDMNHFSELINFIVKNNIKQIFISHDKIDFNAFFSLLEELNKKNIKLTIASQRLKILYRNFSEKFYGANEVISFSSNNSEISIVSKKIVDFFLAFIGVIVLSPVFLLIAVIIKVTSKGPIIFKQVRIGKNGRPFNFYKFRSMYHMQGEDDERKMMMIDFMKKDIKQSNDAKIINQARVTWIGKLLRRTSIDELPQLFNVLKGDMSLVGPRPCIPYEFENYELWHKKRVNVLPGCTGLWQVSGRSLVSFSDSILLDLCYVYKMSIGLDLKIILKTLPVMFFSKGGK